jgi:hypothetical protein
MNATFKHTRIVWCSLALLGAATACSPTANKSNLVAQAYDSSGTLSGVPYKRTIFSSTDF